MSDNPTGRGVSPVNQLMSASRRRCRGIERSVRNEQYMYVMALPSAMPVVLANGIEANGHISTGLAAQHQGRRRSCRQYHRPPR